ncbi:MAG: hypothetical protein QM755_21300 [Luteolibacter sp.]
MDLDANDVAVTATGTILAAGSAHYNFAVARLAPSGAADPWFSAPASPRSAQTTTDDNPAQAVVQPDGKIVTAGIVTDGAPPRPRPRHPPAPNGTLDPTFGTGAAPC